jgi:hypothetical protein
LGVDHDGRGQGRGAIDHHRRGDGVNGDLYFEFFPVLGDVSGGGECGVVESTGSNNFCEKALMILYD